MKIVEGKVLTKRCIRMDSVIANILQTLKYRDE